MEYVLYRTGYQSLLYLVILGCVHGYPPECAPYYTQLWLHRRNLYFEYIGTIEIFRPHPPALNLPHAGQIDQIDHDLDQIDQIDHLGPNLPL